MLTGERFGHYLLEREGFEKFNIKRSKLNSRYRLKKGIPTVFLLEKHSLQDWTSIQVAAHEVGHAIDLKGSKGSVLMSYVYVYSMFFFLAGFFSKLFVIPLILFAIICTTLYIKSEIKAEQYKRNLIKRHLNDALLSYNDARDPSLLINQIDEKIRNETFQIYRAGVFGYFIAPLIVILTS